MPGNDRGLSCVRRLCIVERAGEVAGAAFAEEFGLLPERAVERMVGASLLAKTVVPTVPTAPTGIELRIGVYGALGDFGK
jgi:hypothetical protein